MGEVVHPPQTPLFEWAIEKLKGMTYETWNHVRQEILTVKEAPTSYLALTA